MQGKYRFVLLGWIYLLLGSLPVSVLAEEERVSVSFDEVQPVFREHCLGCHNDDKKRGDLSLDSYAAAMAGGASGEVVYAGDLESSRLWQLINHDDSPEMPPDQDRIADAKLALVRQWIEQGAAEHTGGKRATAKTESLQFQPISSDQVTGGAIPVDLLLQPVRVTNRAAAISALSASPTAPVVAVAGQHQICLYGLDTHELLGIIPFPEGIPYALRFSRDGSLLLAAGGQGAQLGVASLYDVATGRRIANYGDEFDALLAADIDATLQIIAFGGPSKVVKVFSTGNHQELYRIKKHTDWIQAVEFSPDGKWLATADRAGGLVVWEAETGREFQVHEGHKNSITAISWRSDSNMFATSSEDGNVRLWTRDQKKPNKNWAAHPGGATCVQFARDGSLVTHGRDGQPKHWDANGKLQKAWEQQPDIGTKIAVSADSAQIVAGDWTGQVWCYVVESANTKHTAELLANPPGLQAQIAQVETQKQQHVEQIVVLKAEVARLVEAINAARAQYLKHTAELAAVAQRAQSTAKKFHAVDDLSDSTRVAQLRETLDTESKFVAGLERLVDKTRQRLLSLIDDGKKITAQLKAENAGRDQLARRHQTLHEAIARFQSAPHRLAEQSIQAEKRVQVCRAELNKAKEQLDAQRKSTEPTAGDVDAQVEKLQATVNQTQSDLAELELQATRARDALQLFHATYGTPSSSAPSSSDGATKP